MDETDEAGRQLLENLGFIYIVDAHIYVSMMKVDWPLMRKTFTHDADKAVVKKKRKRFICS